MRTKTLLIALNMIVLYSCIFAQNTPGGFYQLKDGDKKEYIIESKYMTSKKFEVLKDTLLSNGKTYKKISWTELSNSLADPVTYEYQRTDTSGKVYIFWLGRDTLLYDFSKNRWDIYPSPFEGLRWRVKNKYKSFAFGDSISAVDLELTDNNMAVQRTETLLEKAGLYDFAGSSPVNQNYKKGTLWGGIIGGKQYGGLFAWDKNIDWFSFYPLQPGNLWKYWQEFTPYRSITRVMKDTLLSDGKVYKKIGHREFFPTYPESYRFESMDSAGNLYSFLPSTGAERFMKLSACVGDTIIRFNNVVNRITAKRSGAYSYYFLKKESCEIENKDVNSLGAFGSRYEQGIGRTYSMAEFFYETLTGVVLNGTAYGDTLSPTGVRDKITAINKFSLFQNYPNPFNPVTNISYSLSDECYVKLKVYDMLGREVALLVNERKPAGAHRVQFDGRGLASGIYVYTMQAGKFRESRTLMLMK